MILLYNLTGWSFGQIAGSLAGLALALTPISVTTYRRNKIRIIYILWAIVLACHEHDMVATVVASANNGELTLGEQK